MVFAEKVRGTDSREWIKVTFKYDEEVVKAIASVEGALYSSAQRVWAIPFSSKRDFENKVGDFLIIWTDGTDDPYKTNGGIDEKMIPDQPIVPGYSVTYDEDRNIIGSTGFKRKPWGEFQVKGFNLIFERPFLILADDAGLGKTFQVSTAIEAKKKMGQLKHGLIIAKASLLYNWRDEIHQHTNEKALVISGSVNQRMKMYDQLMYSDDWTFAIMSYETFRGDTATLQLVDNTRPLDFAVLDEAHKIKNPESKIGADIHKIPFKFRYVLTATPIINSPLDSFNYLKFGKATDLNWFEFENHFAKKGGYANREIISYRNMKELRGSIQTNMLRRRKKDKLKELPDVTFRYVPLTMTKEQERLYKAVRLEILEDLKDTSLEKIPSALAKLLRLQQVTDSTELIGAKASKTNSAKLTALDEALEDLITESGEKVIVFSRFRSLVEIVQERYAKFNPAVIHGDIDANGKSETSAVRALKREYGSAWPMMDNKDKQSLIDARTTSERQEQVYKFQNDDSCKLFIGCTPACREGLTLTAATHVVFLDKEWAPAYVEQAYSRAHRIGQRNNVTVHTFYCEGTIDEKVEEVLKRKESIAQTMIDDGVDAVAPMKAKELISLLAGA
ncbi:DEAD/DEAH box helicase [Peribacillus frigoritolerans]|uniref:DEAD/DEAH box helicase n=1 Tax=Peribacillus castrilensis TaxID=2897690 RepID=A0AAW9NMP6_9BACI|nr:DEAD/DEAH box helicase [Peribacillus castrilensis]